MYLNPITSYLKIWREIGAQAEQSSVVLLGGGGGIIWQCGTVYGVKTDCSILISYIRVVNGYMLFVTWHILLSKCERTDDVTSLRLYPVYHPTNNALRASEQCVARFRSSGLDTAVFRWLITILTKLTFINPHLITQFSTPISDTVYNFRVPVSYIFTL